MPKKRHPDISYLTQHKEFFGDETVTQMGEIKKGQVVNFSYNAKQRQVFVIHPNWHNKLHGLDLVFIPRAPFLKVVNAPESYSEEDLYRKIILQPEIQKFDAYRTYDRQNISAMKTVLYDSSLQPDEKSEPGIEEHHSVQKLKELLEGLQ